MSQLRSYIIIIFTVFSAVCHSQLRPEWNVPSPDVAAMSTFGSVPVSLYTGTPDVSIPLYDIKIGNYNMPITASYHLASVKPHLSPSILGVGWSLIAGGYITRTVREFYDEKKSMSHSFGFLYNYHAALNITSSQLGTYISNTVTGLANGINYKEIMADEFSFNFCGYSGNFYLNANGKWEVVSDYNIEIEPCDTTELATLDDIGQTRIKTNGWQMQNNNKKFFKKFVILTPDGCRYEFGGLDATEFSIPYYSKNTSDLIATTWFLKKITTPQQREILFNYVSQNPRYNSSSSPHPYMSCNIQFSPQKNTRAWVYNNQIYQETSSNAPVHSFSGFLTFPVYLQSIETVNERLSFSYSWNNNYYKIFPQNLSVLYWEQNNDSYIDPFKGIYNPSLQFTTMLDNVTLPLTQNKIIDRLKPLILDSITVTGKYGGETPKTISFSHNNTDIRPRLLDIVIKEKRENKKLKYNFEYNEGLTVNSVGTIDVPLVKTDAWGFCNAGTWYSVSNDYNNFTYGPPNLQYAKAETLKKITYPTGGYSQFTYELNTYSKSVAADHVTIQSTSGYAGGLRIKQVKTYDGTKTTTTDYIYSENLNGSPSSGILSFMPQSSVTYIFGTDPNTYQSLSIQSKGGFYIQPTNFNTPVVGYSCVIAKTTDDDGNDLGFVRHRFANYDADIYGKTHTDEEAYYSTTTSSSAYFPFTSRSLERGKPISEEFFDSSGNKKKEILYRYKYTDDGFMITPCQLETWLISDDQMDITTGGCGWLTKTITGRYLLSSDSTVTYYNSGNISAKIEYEYDTHNQLIKEYSTTSEGKRKLIYYTYPDNFVSNNKYSWMHDMHIFNTLLARQVVTNGNIDAERYDYSKTTTGVPFMCRAYHTWEKSNKKQIDFQVKWTDKYGNPVEITEKGIPIVLIWTRSGQDLIAKIENVSRQEVKRILGYDLNNISESTEEYANSDIELLRQHLPLARFTIYRHDANHNIESITPPNGKTIYYNHDAFGRLRESYMLTDSDPAEKKLLNIYDYKYAR